MRNEQVFSLSPQSSPIKGEEGKEERVEYRANDNASERGNERQGFFV